MTKSYRPDWRSVRIAFTTDDLAEYFNVHPETIRRWIREDKLVFTGNAVKDFNMLAMHWSQKSPMDDIDFEQASQEALIVIDKELKELIELRIKIAEQLTP